MANLASNTVYYAGSFVLAASVSLLALPIVTLKLDPSHYGEFALFAAIVGAVHGIFTSATGYYINGHYPRSKGPERARTVASILLSIAILTALGAGIALLCLTTLPERFGGAPIPFGLALGLALSVIPLGFWTGVSQMWMLDERALPYAVGVAGAPLVAVLATIAILFSSAWRTEALIVGHIVSNVAIGLFCLPWIVRRARARAAPPIVAQIHKLIPVAFPANGFEAVQPAVERALLSNVASLHVVGLLVHAQTYYFGLARLTKSVGLSTFPLSLREAGESAPTFPRTRRVWAAVYFGLIVVVLGFVFFGEWVIAALTHGKFVEAHPIACALLICVPLQFMGRQAIARIYAQSRVRLVSAINLAANFAGLVMLFALVPAFGVYGAVGAFVLRYLVNRIGVLIWAWPIGLREDLLPALGALYALGALLAHEIWQPDDWQAIWLFALALAIWTLAARRAAGTAAQLIAARRQAAKPAVGGN